MEAINQHQTNEPACEPEAKKTKKAISGTLQAQGTTRLFSGLKKINLLHASLAELSV